MAELYSGKTMPYSDLREFLEVLEQRGELKRIKERVSPELEITEIYRRVFGSKGPALLFENVKDSQLSVAINLFGTEQRMALALEVDRLEALQHRIGKFVQMMKEPPVSFLDKIKQLPKLMEAASFLPKTVGSGPCKEIILKGDEVDLAKFPILKCWPKDAGRYITYPLVFTNDPLTGRRNCGTYRMQVIGKNKTLMHFHPHKDAARHYNSVKSQISNGKKQPFDPPNSSGTLRAAPSDNPGGKISNNKDQRLEAAVAIGSDPAVMFASVLPLPPDIDEMIAAGLIRAESVKMVKCETVNLEVPANAEIVLEGYLSADNTNESLMVEGPFGDHTGYYSVPEPFPVFHIDCLTMRKNPIYHTIVVGPPNQEDAPIGAAIEQLFMPLMKMTIPELVDYHMPPEGMFNNLMLVSIKKQYPGHARKVMHSIWGLGQAMFTKCVIVFDEGVNLRDYREVVWKSLISIDPKRDIEFVKGPMDILDHATEEWCYGSKMGIDATKKWKEEGFTREWPEEIMMDKETVAIVDGKWESLKQQIFGDKT